MIDSPAPYGQEQEAKTQSRVPIWLQKVALGTGVLFVFLVSMESTIDSIRMLSQNAVEGLIVATSNPFMALFMGLLATAIIQSSTTTSSIIVAFVASGSLTLKSAVPMIMGANIGTTITCLLVSFVHLTKNKSFKKAFGTASYHHFFNVCTTLILFPMEYYGGFLSNISTSIASVLYFPEFPQSDFNIFKYIVYPISDWFTNALQDYPVIALILSIVLLFLSVRGFIYLLKNSFAESQNQDFIKSNLNRPVRAFWLGTFFTALVHSSAIMTSLLVTFAASKKLKIKKAFPFIVGANIGTTFTALTGALAISSPAIAIALVHVLFNSIGAILFLGIPLVKELPFYLAKKLVSLVVNRKYFAIVYLILAFFILPFSLIFTSKINQHISEYTVEKIKIPSSKIVSELWVANLGENKRSGTVSIYQNDPGNKQKAHVYKREFKIRKWENYLLTNHMLFQIESKGFCVDQKVDSALAMRVCYESDTLVQKEWLLKYVGTPLQKNQPVKYSSIFLVDTLHGLIRYQGKRNSTGFYEWEHVQPNEKK